MKWRLLLAFIAFTYSKDIVRELTVNAAETLEKLGELEIK